MARPMREGAVLDLAPAEQLGNVLASLAVRAWRRQLHEGRPEASQSSNTNAADPVKAPAAERRTTSEIIPTIRP